MRHIEDKLQQFLNKTLLVDIYLNEVSLDDHNIRYKETAHLEGTMFENGSLNWSVSFQNNPNEIFIGAYSSIRDGGYMRSNFFMGRHSGLGRRCSVAAGLHNISGVAINSDTIMAHVSNYSDEELTRLGIRRDQTNVHEMNSRPAIIENDVFLGDNIIVMPGVTIGNGSVIAANSVVSRDIPPYVIAGGMPCKPMRDRFPDDVKEALMATKWWNAKLEILKSLPVDNVFRFIEKFSELDDTKWDDIPTLAFKE